MSTEELIESDSVAVLKGSDNSLNWLPVFLDEDGKPFVSIDGQYQAVKNLQGFQRYEKVRRKKLYNTATGRMVEA